MSGIGGEGILQVRKQGLGEEIANAISHGLGALLAIAGTVLLLVRSALYGSPIAVVSAALYGASMILLYTISCLYHALTLPRGKRVFQVLDHCSIFLLILGTYIPIALVGIGGAFGWVVFGVIAFCAVLGVTLNAVNLHRFKRFSLVLYVAMGWLAVFTIRPIYDMVSAKGILFLLLGGVAYTLGVWFYRKKESNYMHFVWHIFVLAGSTLHFCMIYQYFCYAI
ncbi:MAG: hlyIII [Firmicutes bacterium]|nr:hlyIII [Bacillota bacterium]